MCESGARAGIILGPVTELDEQLLIQNEPNPPGNLGDHRPGSVGVPARSSRPGNCWNFDSIHPEKRVDLKAVTDDAGRNRLVLNLGFASG